MKKADKSGARYALLLGDEELVKGTVTLKDMMGDNEQLSLPVAEIGPKLVDEQKRA